jgi:hypothetical protein
MIVKFERANQENKKQKQKTKNNINNDDYTLRHNCVSRKFNNIQDA